MKITVYIKHVYGNEMVYPLSPEAKLLCALTGNKTFNHHQLQIIKELGYEIEVERPALI